MDQNLVEAEKSKLEIEEPDLDNLEQWLQKYITKPFKGMEDKTHPDGNPFTEIELLEVTKDQLRNFSKNRHSIVEYRNKIRQKNGLDPLSEEEYDKRLKEDFMAIGSELQSRE